MESSQVAPARHHQRSKSSVLRSFMGHRRNNSDGTALPSRELISTDASPAAADAPRGPAKPSLDLDSTRQPAPLGELQQNQQSPVPRSPNKARDEGRRSPTKNAFATISLKSLAVREADRVLKSKEAPTGKPKKAKSSTNLAGLLSRPKSSKNLKKLADEENSRTGRDKENRTPPGSLAANEYTVPPPIYAQFTSQPTVTEPPSFILPPAISQYHGPRDSSLDTPTTAGKAMEKGSIAQARPMMSGHSASTTPCDGAPKPTNTKNVGKKQLQAANPQPQKGETWAQGAATPLTAMRGGLQGLKSRTKAATPLTPEPFIDPKDIDKHLEAMLDRRNIPENQRYKMRNLNDTIKMEFIRQDWAETQAAQSEQPGTQESDNRAPSAAASDREDSKKKKHRSLTLGRGGGGSGGSSNGPKGSSSPSKKARPEGTLGRHFRSKSTESVVSDRPSSAGSASSSGLMAKIKGQQRPSDFVAYLRKVQKPEAVEVGKLHKLRLLLRNETVAWTEEFIRQGGMEEIVGLLYRILEVEWREEHEDALLHENLLCLKALCTTALALQYLHSIRTTLFPALLHMIFDPEKKGPSEFTTRNIITSVLLTYIECATPQERLSRAQTVLGYLRDPEPKEEERPVSFVLEMRRERPYRVWCKEAVNVTKEVFWIFLHNLNVIALPPVGDKPGGTSNAAVAPTPPTGQPDTSTVEEAHATCATATSSSGSARCDSASGSGPAATGSQQTELDSRQLDYMIRHFPQERTPVPAAPYVGGVEWDATNYLASHLDLMNAILACTGPTAAERNALREQLRISGWERCLGGSLRLCKEKFYGAVHDGLRTWVAAAAEDGWDVRDVRYGPPPESRSVSPVKCAGGGNKKNKAPPPRLEMPKLDFALDSKLDGKGAGDDGLGGGGIDPWSA
ncbi:hypothetical protein VTK73DRAFT_8521 [Phialemonium thermophilum]|uniref:Formin GTPase-binding domain-containing protein n=1 Tax=Phialemonium thermophilum TaxID=223376 RepID=A0ABR3W871_9PEZI